MVDDGSLRRIISRRDSAELMRVDILKPRWLELFHGGDKIGGTLDTAIASHGLKVAVITV